jgi:hypothetical protein
MQYGFAQTRPKYSTNLNFLRSKTEHHTKQIPLQQGKFQKHQRKKFFPSLERIKLPNDLEKIAAAKKLKPRKLTQRHLT